MISGLTTFLTRARVARLVTLAVVLAFQLPPWLLPMAR